MPFLPPNQQRQSSEGSQINQNISCIKNININHLDSKITQLGICKGVVFVSSEKCAITHSVAFIFLIHRNAAVSRCHLVPPSAALRLLLFHFSSFTSLSPRHFADPLFELLIVIVVSCLDYTLFQLYT